jgi:DUF4097 and DUF4098 domain-containing protein YvlB
MSAQSVFKMGLLSVIAATGLSAGSGFAADVRTTSQSEHVTAKAVSGDVKSPETAASQWQVVDPKGNVYLLTPLKIKDGKASVEYVTPYTMPTSH